MSYQGVELERDIQTKCNAILRDLGIPFFHIAKGASHKSKFQRLGFPDLIFWYKGKSFSIELKTAKGRVKPEQQAWLNDLSEQGVQVSICRSVEEFTDFLKLNKVMR